MSVPLERKYLMMRHLKRNDADNPEGYRRSINKYLECKGITDDNIKEYYYINPSLEKNIYDTRTDAYDDLEYDIEKAVKIHNDNKIISHDKVKIYCSPFLRCMETSMVLAKVLNKHEVHIDYGLSEWIDSTIMNSSETIYPIDLSKIYSISLQEFNNQKEKNHNTYDFRFINKSENIIIHSDETVEAYRKRINDTINRLIVTSSEEYIIFVTHADAYKQYSGGQGMKDNGTLYKINPLPEASSLSGGSYNSYMKYIKYRNKIYQLLNNVIY